MSTSQTNNVSLVKLTKKVDNKLDLAKAALNVILSFRDIKISETKLTVMSYFMVYGVTVSTKNLIVKSQVCKNLANLKIIMVELKKLELIYKDDLNGKVYVSKDLNFQLNESIALYFKIDNKI